MDNQEYEDIQRACTDHTRTTVSNPIDEVHDGLALVLLRKQFEHEQFPYSRAYEKENGGKHEPYSSNKSSLLVSLAPSGQQVDRHCSLRPVDTIVSSFARKTACIREMQSNRTMPAVTHNHCTQNHRASYQALQSTSLNGRLAALVCLAIPTKHGLWKDRLLAC
jgi:hypothetical protein